MKKNLILLGMMGAGKSTLGKIVAKKQGLKFIDTDRNVEKNNGMKMIITSLSKNVQCLIYI